MIIHNQPWYTEIVLNSYGWSQVWLHKVRCVGVWPWREVFEGRSKQDKATNVFQVKDHLSRFIVSILYISYIFIYNYYIYDILWGTIGLQGVQVVPFSILYYFVTKELAASLAVEGKARGVDVHAVHPSPAACSAMRASCVPLTCHGPSWACVLQGCSMHNDSQRLKPCKGKLPLHFWWWQWCQGAQNEHVAWLHIQ